MKSAHDVIEGVKRNMFIHLAKSTTVDIKDFFIRNIMLSAAEHYPPKICASWIQLFLDHDLEQPYVTDSIHEYLLLMVCGPPPAPSKDKGKGIMGTSQHVPQPEAKAHQLLFQRRTSIGAAQTITPVALIPQSIEEDLILSRHLLARYLLVSSKRLRSISSKTIGKKV